MAVSSLRFRIEGENSSALRSISDVKRAAGDLGGQLQRNIGDKLKDVFSATAIEELVRRTGEWAKQLRDSADALGTDVTSMQSLEIMSRRAGVSQDKLINFYQKLESAATKAKSANDKFGKSFQSLGVGWGQLKGPNRLGTVELGQTVLSNALNPGGQAALQQLGMGRSFLDIRKLARESGGKSVTEYAGEHSSQIVSEEQVDMMAGAWRNIIDDFKSIGTALRPLAGLFLLMADGVAKMVNGIVTAINDAIFGLPNLIKHPITTLSNLGRNATAMGGGLVKMGSGLITGPVDWMFGTHWGQGVDSYLGEGVKGMTAEKRRSYEGLGEGLGTVLTFGAGPILKGTGLGTRGVGASAEIISGGRIGGGVSRIGTVIGDTTDPLGGGLYGRLFRKKVAGESIGLGIDESAAPGEETAYSWQNAIRFGESKWGKRIGMGGTLAEIGGIGKMDVGPGIPPLTDEEKKMLRPGRQGLLNLGQGGGAGGGNGNLAIGGVFGVDIQSKILNLDAKMVDLLQQIVENTTPDMSSNTGGEDAGSGAL